jgi:hypothetical protein
MFEKLISFFFKSDVKKYLKEEVRDRRFVNYTNAKTILLIFESDLSEQNLLIRNIIQQLVSDGKKVKAWGFVNKKETSSPILQDYRILHQGNLNFLRKPNNLILDELTHIKSDLLIDLTTTEIIPLQYITLYANAACKTGLKKTGMNFYDFMVDLNQENLEVEDNNEIVDANTIYNQIIFYIKSIQTKD